MKPWLLALLMMTAACGEKGMRKIIHRLPGADSPIIIRAHLEIPIIVGGGTDGRYLVDISRGTANQPMSITIAPNVTFTVSNTNFKTPTPSGVASFGSLDLTAMLDNSLRVCGATGNQKCVRALIRTYTTGQPGAGMWNTVEGYGLPITSGGSVVGLLAAPAILASLDVTAKRVVHLSDFTSTPTYPSPYAVDFTDAASGLYATTLVLEYVLQ